MVTTGLATANPASAAKGPARLKRRGRRKRFAVALVVVLTALAYMIYSAIASNSEYYLTVSEVQALGPQAQQSQMKIGGKVQDGTISWDRGSNAVSFTVTDGKQDMRVNYKGIVPDSFQPGADVILEGRVQPDGSFVATTMLAKCASKYEPQVPGAIK